MCTTKECVQTGSFNQTSGYLSRESAEFVWIVVGLVSFMIDLAELKKFNSAKEINEFKPTNKPIHKFLILAGSQTYS